MTMKKKLTTPLIAACLLASVSSWAADETPVLNQAQQASSDKAIARQESAMLQVVNENVVAGFAKVQEAMQLLDQGNKQKEAIAALETASAKFDIAILAKPDLNLIPIDVHMEVAELLTTPELIRKTTDETIGLLKDSKLRQARKLLLPMRDEMVTETVLLPMGTYPDAIKLATAKLIKGEKEEASRILDEAFSSFVVARSILPLSLLRAEAFLDDAALLDKEKEKNKARELVEAAGTQLQVAVLLGYADKKSAAYENLQRQIEALHKEIDGENAVEKLYDELKQGLRKLIGEESRQEAVEDSSS